MSDTSNAPRVLTTEEKIEILASNMQDQQGHVFYLTNIAHTILDILCEDLSVDKETIKARLSERESAFAEAMRQARQEVEQGSVAADTVETTPEKVDLIV
jgi:hypothetical protein